MRRVNGSSVSLLLANNASETETAMTWKGYRYKDIWGSKVKPHHPRELHGDIFINAA